MLCAAEVIVPVDRLELAQRLEVGPRLGRCDREGGLGCGSEPLRLPQRGPPPALERAERARFGQPSQHAVVEPGTAAEVRQRRERPLRARRRDPPPVALLGEALHVAQPHPHREPGGAMHPAQRRCSSVTDCLSAPSSRLATRAPRPSRFSAPFLRGDGLERAVPVAGRHVDRAHLDAVADRVVDDRGRRVEAHRLGVEQRAGEHIRVVTAEPGGGVGDEREARGMTLRKPVLSEAADLVEHPLGELARDALRQHAGHQPVAVPLDASAAAPRRHVAPELVRLARRVVGRHHRQLHHLLLEQRHAERLPEHRLQTLVRIDHRLLAAPPPQVGVDHPPGDRAPAARCSPR